MPGIARATDSSERVGHPPRVLGSLVSVEEIEHVPQPVLESRSVGSAERLLRVGAEEAHSGERQLHFPRAHVVADDRRQRVDARTGRRTGTGGRRTRPSSPARPACRARCRAAGSRPGACFVSATPVSATPESAVSVGDVAVTAAVVVAVFLSLEPVTLTTISPTAMPDGGDADGGEHRVTTVEKLPHVRESSFPSQTSRRASRVAGSRAAGRTRSSCRRTAAPQSRARRCR